MKPPPNYEAWKRAEALRRLRDRMKVKVILAKYKPQRSPSVQTVSGGLPSLGKRR